MQNEDLILKIENTLYHYRKKEEEYSLPLDFDDLVERLQLPEENKLQSTLNEMIQLKLVSKNTTGYTITPKGKQHYEAFTFFQEDKKLTQPNMNIYYHPIISGGLNNGTVTTNNQDCSVHEFTRPERSTRLFDSMSQKEKKEIVPEYKNIYDLVESIHNSLSPVQLDSNIQAKLEQLKNLMQQ